MFITIGRNRYLFFCLICFKFSACLPIIPQCSQSIVLDSCFCNNEILLNMSLLVYCRIFQLFTFSSLAFPFLWFLLGTNYGLLGGQNLQLNLTLWRLGTLPPALIAFDGNVHPIPPQWHMLGLGYNTKSSLEATKQAAVIHYNGQAKPWLDIAFPHLRPFWSKYVNYSNEFIRQCNILDRP